ncbi:MAG: hypothetical protein AB1345_01790 [Chloroflexota bacterium]
MKEAKQGEKLETVQAEEIALSQVTVEIVEAEHVRMSQSAAQVVQATEISLQQGGVGQIAGENVSVQQGGAGVVEADVVEVNQGGIGCTRSRQVSINQGGAFFVSAEEAELTDTRSCVVVSRHVQGGPMRTGLLLAGRVEGEVEALMDTPKVLLAGLVAGTVIGGLLLLGRMLTRRS